MLSYSILSSYTFLHNEINLLKVLQNVVLLCSSFKLFHTLFFCCLFLRGPCFSHFVTVFALFKMFARFYFRAFFLVNLIFYAQTPRLKICLHLVTRSLTMTRRMTTLMIRVRILRTARPDNGQWKWTMDITKWTIESLLCWYILCIKFS